MGKLVDLKRTAADKKAESKRYEIGAEPDDYGYGTSIRLGPAECKKLGFNQAGLLKPGTKILIEAEGYVKSANVELGGKDDDNSEMCLQITKLSIEEDGEDRKARKRDEHLNSLGKPTK